MIIIQAGLVNYDDVKEEMHESLDEAAMDNLFFEIDEGDESKIYALDWEPMSRKEAIVALEENGGYLIELQGDKEVRVEFEF